MSYKEEELKELANQLAQCIEDIDQFLVIYLIGNLGAGKTTFARGFLNFFGFDKVKSPTYSIVETYETENKIIHHFDCYRLTNPEELDLIGIRDYENQNCIHLIEWPEMAEGIVSSPDISIQIDGENELRDINLTPGSTIGEKIFSCLDF